MSSAEGNLTTFSVCAKCKAGPPPDESGTQQTAPGECGHSGVGYMIDGHCCLNDIGKPDEEAEPDDQTHETVGDRKSQDETKGFRLSPRLYAF